MEALFAQLLLLLGVTVATVLVFRRLHVPSSLAYLLVGVLLGPHTAGPVVDGQQIRLLAEFGIVFLLFTIGLNFSLPQLHAMRHQVLGLGTAQVALTTLVVGLGAWALGLPAAAAFVVGAVFAQSSTTIISKQLAEQSEDSSRHGRLGTAMSVFQDVTAVPFVVVIPVLGMAAGADLLAGALGLALGKAVLALLLVFVTGRWLLRPLFHLVAQRRSAELFTLSVLFVCLAAAWVTNSLGLSMAFGAFLAGMVLGETEFRHQVESTIRPFRDVLLGLFFIGIGMLFDPGTLPALWDVALLGTLALLSVKALLVAGIVRMSGLDSHTAIRTGLLLAVGGEFGFALIAIALGNDVLDTRIGQILLTSVLFSMVLAPILIRFNGPIAALLAGKATKQVEADNLLACPATTGHFRDHVVVCGYGRVGQSVAHFLEHEKIPYVALDLDAERVREAHAAGEPVFYGDASEPDVLAAVGVERARLLVISNEDVKDGLRILHHAKALNAGLPVMVRTRDESHVEALRAAGASEVVPETLEAGLMIASQALLMLRVPLSRVVRLMQEQRASKYRLLRGYFRGDGMINESADGDGQRLRTLAIAPGSPCVGRRLDELDLDGNTVTALVRQGIRMTSPANDSRVEANDTLVLMGSDEHLAQAERELLG